MDPRQKHLDYYRTKLNQHPWFIKTTTKAPFLESLRQYCIDNDIDFHLEIQYDNNNATLYMTVDGSVESLSRDIGTCNFSNRDELDDLEDELAKKFMDMIK